MSDDPLGQVEIPFSCFSNPGGIQGSFYLQHMPDQTQPEQASAEEGSIPGNVSPKPDRRPVPHQVDRQRGIQGIGTKDCGLGSIRLSLSLEFSRVGEFWSYFMPETPRPPEPAEFEMNVLYGNLMRAYNMAWPFIQFPMDLVGIVMWYDVHVSAIWLAILIWCTYYPFFAPAVVHCMILRKLFLNYVTQEEAKHNRNHDHGRTSESTP